MPRSSPDAAKTPTIQSASSAAAALSGSAPLSYTSVGLPDMHKDSLAAFYKAYGFLGAAGVPPTLGSAGYPGLVPPPMQLDKTGAYPSIYPPTPNPAAAAALAAYNAYATRMKGPAPNGCRDPYCGGACAQFGPGIHQQQQQAAMLAALAASASSASPGSRPPCTPATCPNGCNQCEHQRYLAALSAYGSFPPGSPYGSAYSSLAAAAALHHRAGPQPNENVCNWIVGDTQCGKKCSSADELLQHLKSHTSTKPENDPGSRHHSPNTPVSSASSSGSSAHQSASPGTPSPASGTSARLSSSSAAQSPGPNHHHSSSHRFHPYGKPPSTTPSQNPGQNSMVAAAAAAAAASAPHLPPYNPYTNPFGLMPGAGPPGVPAAPGALGTNPLSYYSYMANMFGAANRVGPPVPP